MRIVTREKVKKSLTHYGEIESSARPNALIYRRKHQKSFQQRENCVIIFKAEIDRQLNS